MFFCYALYHFSCYKLKFTFLFGRLEKPSFSLLGIMLVVSFGVLLTGNTYYINIFRVKTTPFQVPTSVLLNYRVCSILCGLLLHLNSQLHATYIFLKVVLSAYCCILILNFTPLSFLLSYHLFDHGLTSYLAVAKETEFNLWGFIFIMLAAVMSGFRWSMTQILLQVCYCIMFWQFFYFVLFKYCGRTGYLVLLASYMVAFPFIPVVTELLPLFLCPPEFLKKEEYGKLSILAFYSQIRALLHLSSV
jgi:hypothetical protein